MASLTMVSNVQDQRITAPQNLNVEQIAMEDISKLAPDLDQSYCDYIATCLAVCMEESGHKCGKELLVDGELQGILELSWQEVSERTRRTYRHEERATEDGAVCVAILITTKFTPHRVIEQSRKGTGFDYWLGETKDGLIFDRKARLEVSGIRAGTKAEIQARLNQKYKQPAPSDSGMLDAYIVVVEFSQPTSKVRVRRVNSGVAAWMTS